jgi:hypothetical protein
MLKLLIMIAFCIVIPRSRKRRRFLLPCHPEAGPAVAAAPMDLTHSRGATRFLLSGKSITHRYRPTLASELGVERLLPWRARPRPPFDQEQEHDHEQEAEWNNAYWIRSAVSLLFYIP